MNIKRYNISKPKKYSDKEGNEKTQWNHVGSMTEFHKEDGSISRIIEIPAIGLEANIFEQKPKEDRGGDDSDF
jgi:sortase (surface protein transpeptidase)